MTYLRDCKTSEEFGKEFVKPFVNMKINEQRRLFLDAVCDKFGMDSEFVKFVIQYYKENSI